MSAGETMSGDEASILAAAMEHHRAGRAAQAEQLYRQILQQNPNNPDALHLLGVLAGERGEYETSVDLITRATAVCPSADILHASLGETYRRLGKLELAEASLRTALELNPGNADAHNSLGLILQLRENFDQAEAAFRQALALKPDFPDALTNLGVCHFQAGQRAQAIALFRRAIELQPNFEPAHRSLGTIYFHQGDLPGGFAEFEWRLKGRSAVISPKFAQPRWDGKDLGGKTILLHAEQGFGDVIQSVRYVPLLIARHGKVILSCHPELLQLLHGFPNVGQVVPLGTHAPPFDVYCPLMSLPLAFGTTLLTIPAYVPYLGAKPDLVEQWRQRLGADGGKLRVGLAWAGRPEHENDRHRSIRLEQLASLADVPSVSIHSLQKGPASAQIAQSSFARRMIDWSAHLNDFVDTAALIANLDLVIAVDTSVAHLAGAMAKPVWVLLPEPPDWRWMLKRTDSPWYPTMRLFRQKQAGVWDSAISDVRDALAEKAARGERVGERTGQRRAPAV